MTVTMTAILPSVRMRRQTTSGRIALVLGVLAIIALVAMPWWAKNGTIRSVVELCCYIAVAQMWNLLAGYALFIFAQLWGINPFFAVPLSLIAPAILAIPTYALLHRLDRPYFAIGTWVVAEVLRLLTENFYYVNAGAGMSLRVMQDYDAHTRKIGVTLLCALMLVVTVGGSYWLLRSRYGLAVTAMRDNAVAAASQGVNVSRLRFLIFVATAMGVGLAGSFYFMAQLRINPPAAYDPQWSKIAIFIVMVGGIGSIEGVLIGSMIYFLADRWFGQYGSTYLIVLGLMTLATALYARGGVRGLVCKVIDAPWFPIRRTLIDEGEAK